VSHANNRLGWVAALVIVSCLPFSRLALGQETGAYPVRSVRMIVPFVPGGGPDTIARALGQRLAEDLGQPFIVDNRPGAGGLLGADLLVKSPADGYVVCVCDSGQWAVQPALQKNMPYNAARDFQPVTMLARVAIYLVVRSSLNASNLTGFIALVKANPGKFNYGTPGVGSIHHLMMEVFKSRAGLQLEHIPYKGAGEVVPALLSGQVAISFQGMPAIAAHVKQGNLNLLAVALAKRSPLANEVPTFAESGVEGMDFPGSFAMLAPAATPMPVVTKLAGAVHAALKHPSIVERFRVFNLEATPSSPEAAAVQMRDDLEKFERAAQLAGLKR